MKQPAGGNPQVEQSILRIKASLALRICVGPSVGCRFLFLDAFLFAPSRLRAILQDAAPEPPDISLLCSRDVIFWNNPEFRPC